jgi:hypothetical protein
MSKTDENGKKLKINKCETIEDDEVSFFMSLGFQCVTSSFTKICNYCDQPSKKRCSKCQLASYCSSGCQKEDWIKHKLFCGCKDVFDSYNIQGQYEGYLKRFKGNPILESEFYLVETPLPIEEYQKRFRKVNFGHLFKDIKEKDEIDELINFIGLKTRNECGPWRTFRVAEIGKNSSCFLTFSPCQCCAHDDCFLKEEKVQKEKIKFTVPEFKHELFGNVKKNDKLMEKINIDIFAFDLWYSYAQRKILKLCGPVYKTEITCDKKASKTCQGCKIAKYCGKECQRRDWCSGHKLLCKTLALIISRKKEQIQTVYENLKYRRLNGLEFPRSIIFNVLSINMPIDDARDFIKNGIPTLGHDFKSKPGKSDKIRMYNALGHISKSSCSKPHLIYVTNNDDYIPVQIKPCNCHDHASCFL